MSAQNLICWSGLALVIGGVGITLGMMQQLGAIPVPGQSGS